MPVLREIIALLSVRTDAKAMKDAESRIFRLKTAVGGLVAGFATQKIFDTGEMAARFQDAKAIMEANGQTLDDLRAKAKGLYSDFDLVTNYNRANAFGLGPVFGQMLKVADASSKVLGEKQNFMLDSITRGLARQSSPILDNLAIIVKKRDLNPDEIMAAQGELVKSLEMTGKNALFVGEAMRQGQKQVDAAAKAGATASDMYDRQSNAMQDAAIAAGSLANSGLKVLAPIFEKLRVGMEKLAADPQFMKTMEEIGTAVIDVGHAIGLVLYDVWKLYSAFRQIPGSGLLIWLIAINKAMTSGTVILSVLHKALPVFGLMAGQAGAAGGAVGTLASRLQLAAKANGLLAASFAKTGIVAAVMLAAIEEAFAPFDDEKMGYFEQWSGRFSELIGKLSGQEAEGFFPTLLKGFRMMFSEVFAFVDTLMGVFIGSVEIIYAMLTGGPVEAMKAAVGQQLDDYVGHFGMYGGSGEDFAGDTAQEEAFVDAQNMSRIRQGQISSGISTGDIRSLQTNNNVIVNAGQANPEQVAAMVSRKIEGQRRYDLIDLQMGDPFIQDNTSRPR